MPDIMTDDVQTYIQDLIAKNFESKSKKENGFPDNRKHSRKHNNRKRRCTRHPSLKEE